MIQRVKTEKRDAVALVNSAISRLYQVRDGLMKQLSPCAPELAQEITDAYQDVGELHDRSIALNQQASIKPKNEAASIWVRMGMIAETSDGKLVMEFDTRPRELPQIKVGMERISNDISAGDVQFVGPTQIMQSQNVNDGIDAFFEAIADTIHGRFPDTVLVLQNPSIE